MAVKDSVLKVVKSPVVRKAVVALIVAILGALGLSVGSGCGGSLKVPAVPPEVVETIAVAACVKAELDAAGDPEALTLGDARELAKRLAACRKPAGDAGTE